jgi:hypothetical protein
VFILIELALERWSCFSLQQFWQQDIAAQAGKAGEVEDGVFGPVHDLIWRLSDSYGEESLKVLRKQNAENVLFVPVHGSVD